MSNESNNSVGRVLSPRVALLAKTAARINGGPENGTTWLIVGDFQSSLPKRYFLIDATTIVVQRTGAESSGRRRSRGMRNTRDRRMGGRHTRQVTICQRDGGDVHSRGRTARGRWRNSLRLQLGGNTTALSGRLVGVAARRCSLPEILALVVVHLSLILTIIIGALIRIDVCLWYGLHRSTETRSM